MNNLVFNTEKPLYVQYINIANVGGEVISKIETLKDATRSDASTAISTNMNFGSTNTTKAQNKYKTSLVSNPLSGGTVVQTITQLALIYSSVLQVFLIIPPGHSVAVRATVTLGVTINFVAEIAYREQAE